MEIEVQDDFLSFDADLVAEQLTYMDAVSGEKNEERNKDASLSCFCQCFNASFAPPAAV